MLATHAPTPSPALAPSDEHDLNAYNAAFLELELGWYWDARTYLDLLRIGHEKQRIQAYIERYQPHLLRAYDAHFLSDLIFDTKRRLRAQM
jgi:hypothetical protein